MKFRALVVLAASIFSLAVFAGEEIDQDVEATADGLVEIINARGEIRVLGWDEDRVQVEGELDDLAENFIFEVRGDTTRIEVVIPKRNANWGDGSDLVIQVPEKSRVSVKGVSSDISVEGLTGGIRLQTASGDIRADQVSESYDIRSVSGDIDITNGSGRGNVSTVSGEIKIESDSPSLMLDTVSGDIEVVLDSTDRLIANAVSGEVEISTHLSESGDIDIRSVSGDVVLELQKPVDARINVETGPGGDITNRLSDDPVQSRFPAMKALSAKLGDGSGQISMRTVSGDIRLDSIE